MIVRNLLLPILLALSAPVYSGEYMVNVDGCPSPITLSTPDVFFQATSSYEKKRRSEILERLHDNPHRTARYSDILLMDWRSERALPQILVASLGSTRKIQGSITDEMWQSLKEKLLASTKSQQEMWMRKGMKNLGYDSEIEAKITTLVSGKANEITMLGETSFESGGDPINVYTAAKMIYVHQCIAQVSVAVDATAPGAFEQVVQYATQIHVNP